MKTFLVIIGSLLSTLAWGDTLQIKDSLITTPERLSLTRDYAKRHFGIEDWHLRDPKGIVIHYTVTGNLADALAVFAPARVSKSRKVLADFGDLNVGVHYLVDKEGSVYRLLPDDVMGRHAIGLNHCAIGIENVGMNANDLTAAQLASNVLLVQDLTSRYKQIRFLLGHHELNDRQAPHWALMRLQDSGYRPGAKSDPGPEFMQKLRAELSSKGIRLER